MPETDFLSEAIGQAAEESGLSVDVTDSLGDVTEPEEQPEQTDDPDAGAEATDPEVGEQPTEEAGEPEVDSEADVESDEETAEDQSDEPELLELQDDAQVEVNGDVVDARELKDGYLRQDDYTRKTQELADEREQVEQLYEQMEAWYDERMSDPAAWAREIADESGGDQVLGEAIAASQDPNRAFGQVVKHLVESDVLADEVVQGLGLQDMSERASEDNLRAEIDRLQQRLDEREKRDKQQKQEVEQQREALRYYEQQFQELTDRESLTFESDSQREEAFMGLMQWASNNGIQDLGIAYDALARRRAKQQPASTQDSAGKAEQSAEQEAKEAVQSAKKKTSAMSSKPSGGSTATKQTREPGDILGAIKESVAEVI